MCGVVVCSCTCNGRLSLRCFDIIREGVCAVVKYDISIFKNRSDECLVNMEFSEGCNVIWESFDSGDSLPCLRIDFSNMIVPGEGVIENKSQVLVSLHFN